jgi:hypothetical protein
LSLVLEDMVIFVIGCVVGLLGISLTLTIGAAVLTAFRHAWRFLMP